MFLLRGLWFVGHAKERPNTIACNVIAGVPESLPVGRDGSGFGLVAHRVVCGKRKRRNRGSPDCATVRLAGL